MGLPAFVSLGTYTTTAGATTLTPTLPATRTNNNLLISYISVKATGQSFTLGGTDAGNWTIGDSINTGNQSMAWAWRIVDGTEVAVAWSWGSSVAGAGQIAQFSGNATPTPTGNKNSAAANSSTTATVASITSSQDNSLIFAIIMTATSQTIPLPTNYTNIANAANANSSVREVSGAVGVSGRASDAISVAISSSNWASVGIEILGSGSGSDSIRSSQVVLEVLEKYDNPTQVRSSQVVLQVLRTTTAKTGHVRFNMPMMGR